MKLQRHPANPILSPDLSNEWETNNVFNPSVIHHNGLFHMHYRAQGLDWISRIGYALSEDGINWNRLHQPVLAPANPDEARGVEDPRITEIDGVFYMAFTAYAGEEGNELNITPMFARSENLITWTRIGALVRGENNKDHCLFPKIFDGRYLALHRRPPSIWLAESTDLSKWPKMQMQEIMSPRPENEWDSKQIGGNGPPIETDHGWLMFYHGYNEETTYRLGVCLLDLDDPSKIIHRPEEWILEPEEEWEISGQVPNVVFSCANIRVGDQVYVYYGGADRVIGLATCDYDELVDFAMTG
jgi:predicted GH43/DUF377 family glycosyl hydrolase